MCMYLCTSVQPGVSNTAYTYSPPKKIGNVQTSFLIAPPQQPGHHFSPRKERNTEIYRSIIIIIIIIINISNSNRVCRTSPHKSKPHQNQERRRKEKKRNQKANKRGNTNPNTNTNTNTNSPSTCNHTESNQGQKHTKQRREGKGRKNPRVSYMLPYRGGTCRGGKWPS